MYTYSMLSFLRAESDELSIASIAMPCDGVNCSNASFLPARSSTLRIAGSLAMMASAPRVLSTIITALPSWPLLRRFGCSCAQ